MRGPGKARLAVGAAATLVALMAAGCSGSGGTSSASAGAPPAAGTPPAATPPTSPSGGALSGTVAVGAPISAGLLKVTDADGNVIASDVPIGADGRYDGVALTGKGPWMLEACGYAADRWMCLRSTVAAAGTGNVTPLTDAIVQVGASAGDALRAGLASLLADAGLPADFDFTTGALAAGSRAGYDRLLDAVGVSKGEDAKPFVQITPRLGSGNLYLEQGEAAVGQLAVAAGAAALPLAGLETLFRDMNAAIASPQACAATDTGLRRSMADDARLSFGEGMDATSGDQVAQAMCEFFGMGPEGGTVGSGGGMWGAQFASPVLGRCDFSGAQPVCGVSFVLRAPDGTLQPVGQGMGVRYVGAGTWKFVGDLLPVQIHASASVQRTRRIDGAAPVDQFMRALSFDIAAASGVACASVSQRDAQGSTVPVAFFKRHGASAQRRLSLWTTDGQSNVASLDPAVGATRAADDTWVALPEGAAGDTVIRNFYRGGRAVQVALFSDANCVTPAAVGGRSSFEVEVAGVPPVWSAMASLPWPEPTAAAATALREFVIAPGAAAVLPLTWTFPRGAVGVDQVGLCSAGSCGEGSPNRLADGRFRPGATEASVSVAGGERGLAAASFRSATFFGRLPDGMGLQANFVSCSAQPAGQMCTDR